LRLFALLCALLYASNTYASAADSSSYEAIAARLQPDGLVNIQGQNNLLPVQVVDAARPDRGGNEIFSLYCSVCHATGAAGAPKFGCASAWKKRTVKSATELLQHVKNGFHFMPAKGTCLDCSEGELEDAMHYMINHSKKDDASCQKPA